jgi:hypothetical protein
MDNFFVLKDVNNKFVTITGDELMSCLCSKEFRVLEMTIDEIVELKCFYEEYGGTLPVTTSKIDAIFPVWKTKKVTP